MAVPRRSQLRSMWRFHKLIWRVSGRRIGSNMGGLDVLELVTTGHRSGQPRSVLLFHLDSPGGPLVVGSNAGEDHDPAWVTNLRADTSGIVKIKRETRPVRALFLDGAERDREYRRFVDAYPDYRTYSAMTEREIPVIVLTPLESSDD